VQAGAWQVTASRLVVRVYRDGPMQKLGHNHVIVSDALAGTIAMAEPLAGSTFDLGLPLGSLEVDADAARAAAGQEFAEPVPKRDREATRQNMLGPKLLDAARQDVIRLRCDALTGGDGRLDASVRVSLAGREHVVTVPVTVSVEGDLLRAHAAVRLTHADLGFEPFSVALGALRVRDDIEMQLTLEARRGS
jgi:hypothetical protein